MNVDQIELAQNEEEKTANHLHKSDAVPILLEKPTLEVEDVDFEPIIQIPSYKLCFAVFFVLVGMTLLVVALVSNTNIAATFFGVRVWVIGLVMILVGVLSAVYVLRGLYRETQEERIHIISQQRRDCEDWRPSS
mmetsp:Transcript_1547/g.3307  ORF Transcript_1547/g.3307 Transcript_1547/m.3307 type:complete len:135 (+) Transcript_1547:559-963(+)